MEDLKQFLGKEVQAIEVIRSKIQVRNPQPRRLWELDRKYFVDKDLYQRLTVRFTDGSVLNISPGNVMTEEWYGSPDGDNYAVPHPTLHVNT